MHPQVLIYKAMFDSTLVWTQRSDNGKYSKHCMIHKPNFFCQIHKPWSMVLRRNGTTKRPVWCASCHHLLNLLVTNGSVSEGQTLSYPTNQWEQDIKGIQTDRTKLGRLTNNDLVGGFSPQKWACSKTKIGPLFQGPKSMQGLNLPNKAATRGINKTTPWGPEWSHGLPSRLQTFGSFCTEHLVVV